VETRGVDRLSLWSEIEDFEERLELLAHTMSLLLQTGTHATR